MNFVPATVQGGKVKTPFGELPLPEGVDVSDGTEVIAGLRPESFEDAAEVAQGHEGGITFKAKVDLVESMGSEQYVYFESEGAVESDELAELAADVGLGETPTAGEHTIVARVDAASKIKRGEEAEIWVDATKLHLFDPSNGKSLTAGKQAADTPSISNEPAGRGGDSSDAS